MFWSCHAMLVGHLKTETGNRVRLYSVINFIHSASGREGQKHRFMDDDYLGIWHKNNSGLKLQN